MYIAQRRDPGGFAAIRTTRCAVRIWRGSPRPSSSRARPVIGGHHFRSMSQTCFRLLLRHWGRHPIGRLVGLREPSLENWNRHAQEYGVAKQAERPDPEAD